MSILYNVLDAETGDVIKQDADASEVSKMFDVSLRGVEGLPLRATPIKDKYVVVRSESDLAYWCKKLRITSRQDLENNATWTKETVKAWLNMQAMFGVRSARA